MKIKTSSPCPYLYFYVNLFLFLYLNLRPNVFGLARIKEISPEHISVGLEIHIFFKALFGCSVSTLIHMLDEFNFISIHFNPYGLR